VKHAGDLPDAVVLLFETGDRHSIFWLQLLVTSGAYVHRLTLTDQMLHFRFESALKVRDVTHGDQAPRFPPPRNPAVRSDSRALGG
jgi:hypothetical protein